MAAAYDNINYSRDKKLEITADAELTKAIIENNALSCIQNVLLSQLTDEEKLKTIRMYSEMALEKEKKL